MTKVLVICIVALFILAVVEGSVIYFKQAEIWRLKDRMFEMSGLEPVFWEDDKWQTS